MRIADSVVQFQARHQTVTRHEVRESLRVWRQPPPPPTSVAPPTSPGGEDPEPALTPDEAKLFLLRLFVERLTGRKLELLSASDLAAPPPATATPAQEGSAPSAPAWGATYDREENHCEAEATTVKVTGLVRTADGREIALDLSLTMSREFVSRTAIHLRAGAALKDPLVVNFTGSAAQLTERRIAFDLDVDGVLDAMPQLASGSAWLALDRNGDGVINDGSELFGALSGDGFADLARHDEDRNGWLDEGDALFAQLRLWRGRDTEGKDQLETLTVQGIGAIHLAAVDSPFALKQEGELNGAVRATAIYLREAGGAGTVQQLDLKI